MQRTGGIIGLIAGILAFFAAVATFFVGTAASFLDAEAAAFRSWDAALYGFLCALVVIIFSAQMMNRTDRLPSIVVVITSVVGFFVGGLFVAICMVLAFIGGLVGLLQGTRRTS